MEDRSSSDDWREEMVDLASRTWWDWAVEVPVVWRLGFPWRLVELDDAVSYPIAIDRPGRGRIRRYLHLWLKRGMKRRPVWAGVLYEAEFRRLSTSS